MFPCQPWEALPAGEVPYLLPCPTNCWFCPPAAAFTTPPFAALAKRGRRSLFSHGGSPRAGISSQTQEAGWGAGRRGQGDGVGILKATPGAKQHGWGGAARERAWGQERAVVAFPSHSIRPGHLLGTHPLLPQIRRSTEHKWPRSHDLCRLLKVRVLRSLPLGRLVLRCSVLGQLRKTGCLG